jgi:hypothetical protein
MVSTSVVQNCNKISCDEKDDIDFLFQFEVELGSYDPMERSLLIYFRKHLKQKDIFCICYEIMAYF